MPDRSESVPMTLNDLEIRDARNHVFPVDLRIITYARTI